MARTFKREPYHWYNKENKEARKRTNRNTRKRNKQILHSTCPLDCYIGDDCSLNTDVESADEETTILIPIFTCWTCSQTIRRDK